MDQNNTKLSAKDFFLNLGATISLYTVVFSLLNLLFTVINSKFPKITNAYQYTGSASISWPVAILIIFVPVLLVLMWVINKNYEIEPQRRNSGVHKWLTYLTIFVSGLVLAGDLVTVLYYFIDGQELTTAFLLKVLALLVVSGSVFAYFFAEVRNKLTVSHRMMWRFFAVVLVLASIAWGFSVLGSPRVQRLAKYDEQKTFDLQSLKSYVEQFYATKGYLPTQLSELSEIQYINIPVDIQSGDSYKYELVGQSAKAYKLCAVFNSSSKDSQVKTYPYGTMWTHDAGDYCYSLSIPKDMYLSPKPLN